MLTSNVFHTISKRTSIILDMKEEKCVLCAHYYISLTTLIIELRTEKSYLYTLVVTHTVIKFLHKFLPFFALTARL